MIARIRATLRELIGSELVVYCLLSAMFGAFVAGTVTSSRTERSVMKWAIENSDDCAEYHSDEYSSVGECLQDRYGLILEERYAEAAAEQYP